MTSPFSYRRRVAWTDVDPSGNYQFSTALRYVEEAEIAWLRELGVLDVLYPHLPRTFVRADYKAPAKFDEVVDVELTIARLGSSSIEFGFTIRRDETSCATGVLGAAYIGDDGRSAELPAVVRTALENASVEVAEVR